MAAPSPRRDAPRGQLQPGLHPQHVATRRRGRAGPLQCPVDAGHRFNVTLTRAPQASPATATARTGLDACCDSQRRRVGPRSWSAAAGHSARADSRADAARAFARSACPPRPACSCAPAASATAPAPPHRGRRAVPLVEQLVRASQPPDQARVPIRPNRYGRRLAPGRRPRYVALPGPSRQPTTSA
jgi:hypothetical protein